MATPHIDYYMQPGDLRTLQTLSARMMRYRVHELVGTDEAGFRAGLDAVMSEERADFEHVTDESMQRQQSISFSWGHDHDFGPFQMEGRMGSRHIKHLAVFGEHFGIDFNAFDGAPVLDLGCWSGGVSLMLSTFGAHVHAVDEVRKYVELVDFLGTSFGLSNLTTEARSLYSMTEERDQDRYAAIMFAGVLYHLTDPIIAMRILFNMLQDGGVCMVESTSVAAQRAVWAYERRQWNWFDPSPGAVRQVMKDVGFTDVRVGPVTPNGRVYAIGRREKHVDMRRDGLSVPTIR